VAYEWAQTGAKASDENDGCVQCESCDPRAVLAGSVPFMLAMVWCLCVVAVGWRGGELAKMWSSRE
jgi:hypothetical protein